MTEEKKKGFIAEFKEFINRGSVIDLAVGVVVGGAFTAIVNSLVNDIITPLIGLILGGVNFSGLSITVKDASINYGMFIQNIINFIIVAFCIFIVVKFMNRMRETNEKNLGKLAEKAKALKEKTAAELKAKSEELKEKSKKK